ncbi:F-box protein At5g49610-like [Solanum dulcamara]|uniref:F-box protein At5g49610-like n=1 Tax=Solanum dulcamara TaxID=45834 RepID=UPI002485171A|nr:F-box protein At5g49610-like [Solanum dulcamara]
MEFSQADYINDDSHHNSHKLDYFNSFISYELPAHVATKKELKIKDVVKEHVLSFLPAKSLMKFRSVSKEWDKWIASPLLAHQQSFSCQSFSGYFYQESISNTMFLSLDHSTIGVPSPALEFLPEVVKILSSCCGLLLCQGLDKYYVCNPATRGWKMLPPPQYYHGDEPAIVLAFEPSLHNIEAYYHVICAFPMIGQPVICFDIYSSESNSWSCSSAHCTDLGNPRLVGGGLFMKGVAYYEMKSNQVLAFDVKEEIPAIISLPVQVGRHGSLTQMESEVCYVTANNESGNVFIIDIYQGMEMSLKRSVIINLGPDRSFTQACEVLPCVNSDAVAIHVDGFIYFYHIREQKVEFITSPGGRGLGKKFLPYINSLGMIH